MHDGATSRLLRSIKYPGNTSNPFGGPRYFIGTVRQEAPPGIRAHLFGIGHLANFAGRVYYMPFTPLQPTRIRAVTKAATGFRLEVIGEPGPKLEIQGSEDLQRWAPVTTVTNGSGRVQAEDATATSRSRRFYRAVQVP